ncbi:uncharacterized protein Dwil_GK21674 [Drosophila willistoni]|uniref:GK21674 n=1 Tax=Drosophila willistoni TaxID=7260 RepID=B4MPA5_DROWI|nr:uncharacterized protein LOC6640575 [Drosophila willistoni]EDW73944.1 uncharacterized protein Dwil_GK21674 [Drosophila willistoni]
MPYDCVTTDEVNYQRYKSDRAEKTHNHWVRTLSWYPKEQASNYIRIDQIHHESRRQYGDKHFAKYAAQRRLNQRFRHSIVDERIRETLYEPLDQERFDDYKWPATTNGVYGSVKPTKLHFC